MYYFNEIQGIKSTIRIQEDWINYILKNREIIIGWLEYNMVKYLQKRNSNVPGIPNKLYPPQERKLEKVKKYWKIIASLVPIYEIYGHNKITETDISIDHFIPWSYVAHDELWNLHPTTKSINSSKSNNLPDWSKYFPALSQLEYTAYKLIWENETIHNEFEKCAREHINNEDIYWKIYRDGLNFEEFQRNLKQILFPTYQAAKNSGFRNWIYMEESYENI